MSDQNLRKALIRLAHAKPELRSELLPLLVKSAQEMAEEANTSGKGGVGGKFLKFLEEKGNDRVLNPETGRKIKIKSLGRTYVTKKIQKKEFEKWLNSHRGRDAGGG